MTPRWRDRHPVLYDVAYVVGFLFATVAAGFLVGLLPLP